MNMGKTILKNVMPCDIRKINEDDEEHENDKEPEDEEGEPEVYDDDEKIPKMARQKRENRGEGGQRGKQGGKKGGIGDKKWNPKNDHDDDFEMDIWKSKGKGKCMAKQFDNDWYWRKEGCIIKRGQFCELTGAYHWKNVASCQSCATCNKGGKNKGGKKGGKNGDKKGGKRGGKNGGKNRDKNERKN